MFTDDFEELIDAFTEDELNAIRNGKVKEGMSREAVLACVGYPPESGTPRIESDVWRYWRHRFSTYNVRFDDEGKVRSIEE